MITDKEGNKILNESNWGINWAWTREFDSFDGADEFVKWLDSKGFDHRGVYMPDKYHVGYTIRWRH